MVVSHSPTGHPVGRVRVEGVTPGVVLDEMFQRGERSALVGGESVTPSEAGALVAELIDGRSPLEGAIVAYEILTAWLAGFEEEPLPAGESKAAPKKRRSRTASPDGPASTPAAA